VSGLAAALPAFEHVAASPTRLLCLTDVLGLCDIDVVLVSNELFLKLALEVFELLLRWYRVRASLLTHFLSLTLGGFGRTAIRFT